MALTDETVVVESSEDNDELTVTADGTFTFAGRTVQSTRDIAAKQGVNLTIYGPAGHGKTTLGASARNSEYASPLYVVDAEAGAEVLAHLDVPFNSYTKWSQITKFIKALKMAKEIPWKTIMWDNLTEISAMNLASISDEPTWPDYAVNKRDMLNFVRDVRELGRARGVNMIFTAWDEWSKDDALGTHIKNIQLTPSLQKAYPGTVSIIGHLSVNKAGDRILSFKPGPTTVSKFRRVPQQISQQIPLELRNPDLGPLFDTLVGGKPFPFARFAVKQKTTTSDNKEKKDTDNE